MQVPEFTVVDFNAGFGGRSLAFRDCGFSVVTAAESDPVKQEILRGIVPNIPIFTEPISLENLSSLPGTDILMADIPAESPARLRVNQKKDDVDSYLHLFSEFILCNQPKAFLMTNSGCVGSGLNRLIPQRCRTAQICYNIPSMQGERVFRFSSEWKASLFCWNSQ